MWGGVWKWEEGSPLRVWLGSFGGGQGGAKEKKKEKAGQWTPKKTKGILGRYDGNLTLNRRECVEDAM